MKYFTRELYDKMQGPYCEEGLSDDQIEKLEDEFDLLWNEVSEKYATHLESIKNQLPNSIKKLRDISLHDGEIESVKILGHEIHFKIDGSNCCWGPQANYTLIIQGVKDFKGVEDIEGDCWLYEEIDIINDIDIEFRVLLEDSELYVVSQEIKLQTEPLEK